MNALRAIREQFTKLGYTSVVSDYVFADIFASPSTNRTARLAAFTHTPYSYRNAAFAVTTTTGDDGVRNIAAEYRALGAPLLFVIGTNDIAVWEVRFDCQPRSLKRVALDQLDALFSEYRDSWSPRSIQQAKSIGQFDRSYQLDFVDVGLLPAIEGEIHTKLDHLLTEAIADAVRSRGARRIDEKLLFRTIFRLLAAKVLQDRGHPVAENWGSSDLNSVLAGIEQYYGLDTVLISPAHGMHQAFEAVWSRLRAGINFSNISSDDLAFVYENTLVTPETRQQFGTHSTPRQLAEYVVSQLELWRYEPKSLRIYEPFSGAGMFLISALRQMRSMLPLDWTDRQRHDFLVSRLSGSEIDPFACEVATLSLILADYPNRNGWHITQEDLFRDSTLANRMQANNVILCNPPFEAFEPSERSKYGLTAGSYSKPITVLCKALESAPLALGFVLPRPFILHKQYAELRALVEKKFENVEIVELPDRIFGASNIEVSALIAREPRTAKTKMLSLRSTVVSDQDRVKFLKSGEVTIRRSETREIVAKPLGDLWIPQLQSIWTYLHNNPTLDTKFKIHRGIEWSYDQHRAWSDTRKPGYRRGLHTARRARQFLLGKPVWLDCREEKQRTGALDWPWSKPKLISNSIRLSRGSWRLAAAVDTSGLICSQQFFGYWPKATMSEREMLALGAILNGPIANAFLAIHSPQKGIRITALNAIPIPATIGVRLSALVSEYAGLLQNDEFVLGDRPRQAELLNLIDAEVLKAYDLPPRLERELLEFFRGSERPVAHPWTHWLPDDFRPFIPLHEYFSDEYKVATQPWIQEVFKPLPADEAAALRQFMD